MNSWFRQHFFALGDALFRIRKFPGNFFLNVLVIGMALTLPFAGLTILENLRPVSAQLSIDPELSLFMNAEAPRDPNLVQSIRTVLRAHHSTGTIEFIPKEKALNALNNKIGIADIATTLGSNPLPDSYVIKLAPFQDAVDANRMDRIATQLKALPNVDVVQVDSAWVKRLAALLNLFWLVLLCLAGFLAIIVIAVTFNTIRLQVFTQREEITLSRLIGATDTFIHRPFYYTGALLGLAAGLIALGAVFVTLYPLNHAVTQLVHLYGATFQFAPLNGATALVLLLISAILGLLGSLLSVRRHLV